MELVREHINSEVEVTYKLYIGSKLLHSTRCLQRGHSALS